MFKWIKKLFNKKQPESEYAHIICILREIQECGAKDKKSSKKQTKKTTKKVK